MLPIILIKLLKWASKMAQLAKFNNLSSIPRAHMVERENQILQVYLRAVFQASQYYIVRFCRKTKKRTKINNSAGFFPVCVGPRSHPWHHPKRKWRKVLISLNPWHIYLPLGLELEQSSKPHIKSELHRCVIQETINNEPIDPRKSTNPKVGR